MSADGAVEDVETFRVILEVPEEETGVLLGVGTAMVTIINNDSKQLHQRVRSLSLTLCVRVSYTLVLVNIQSTPKREETNCNHNLERSSLFTHHLDLD